MGIVQDTHGSNVSSIQVPMSIRHLSISIDNTHVKDRMTFENFKTNLAILGKKLKVENLHTLMLFGEYHGSLFKTFCNLFRKAKSLRVLLLSGASYNVEDLLHNFPQLIHLRYLRIIEISGSEISLPSSIPKCYHLLVLDIENCYCDFGSLGREMRNLVKLRHFVAPVDRFYSSIFEVGKLKSLQKLNCFEVKREPNGFELKQLGKLQQLHGSLGIYNLERVEGLKEAEEARLVHMNHLHRLRLHWVAWQSIKDTKQEEDILESLKPHSYLREISIEGHRGTCCPSWLGEDLSISNLEFIRLDGVAWKKFPPLGELCTTNDCGEECISYITGPRFLNLKRVELHNLPRLKMWRANDSSHLFSCLEELTVRECSELLELPISHCTCSQAEQRFPKLQKIAISGCPKLLSLPPIPWSNDLSITNIVRVGTSIQELSYNKHAYLHIKMGKVDLDRELWKKLSFHYLGQIEELRICNCPPMALENMQMLAFLKTLYISYCTKVLWLVESDSNAQCQIPVEYLEIVNCDASGKELSQLICYFPKLRSLSLRGCKMITELGVAERQKKAKHAPLPSILACKAEDANIGQQRQQTRGDEIEAVDEGKGLLLVPREMLTLMIRNCPNLRLRCPGMLDDSTETRGGLQSLHNLTSLTSLVISGCPKFFASSASSAYSPFPNSLQSLAISDCTNLTSLVTSGFPEFFTSSASSVNSPFPASLQSLTIFACAHLTGEGFWELFPQVCVTELKVYKSRNFFTCTDIEPSRLDQQDLPCYYSRSCSLFTDDIAGVLAQPICARLSPFLTKLVFSENKHMEHFTNKQEAALQILTSLQELEISYCSKLRSLPAGLSGFPNLKRFVISYLDSIESITKDGLPSSLTVLRIERCAAIRSLLKGTLPNSLRNLWIIDCPGIESLPKDTLPSSLQSLQIIDCPGIRSLPKDGFLDSMRLLDVSGSNEELRRQCCKLRGIIPIVRA